MSDNKFWTVVLRYIFFTLISLTALYCFFNTWNASIVANAALQKDLLISQDISQGIPPMAAKCAHTVEDQICNLITATMQSAIRQQQQQIPPDTSEQGQQQDLTIHPRNNIIK